MFLLKFKISDFRWSTYILKLKYIVQYISFQFVHLHGQKTLFELDIFMPLTDLFV